eukprot:137584-Lingulodinium_polyedra.AAC.1
MDVRADADRAEVPERGGPRQGSAPALMANWFLQHRAFSTPLLSAERNQSRIFFDSPCRTFRALETVVRN